ncbi:cilia- and flagella-associated protein 58-like [Ruditapes philippinarum]|uniref:cilia- and flagella-associated protein 58-like n=1 Tax=Ruditapes philippinarum TaxID=129788 RepID=UPI00295B4205|nr:cilia- and flagella-associated protein 58-like [Ruditapes philippinarum]
MEQDYNDSTDDLHRELDMLETRTGLSDKEAEERFILWYEDICKERLEMLNLEEEYKRKIEELEISEDGYRKRIKELENGTISLLKTFEESQSEIEGLRDKYERNGSDVDIYNEPYDIVSKERNRLKEEDIRNKEKIRKLTDENKELRIYENNRESNRNIKKEVKTYKDRIKRLEDEVKMLRHYVKDVDCFRNVKTDKVKYKDPLDKLVVITSSERLKTLESENARLKTLLDKLKNKNKWLISKLEVLETQVQARDPEIAKTSTCVKSKTETIVINKKSIPTFLPKIESDSFVHVTEKKRSGFISSFSKESPEIPFLRYGLGYRELYKRMLKRQQSKDKDMQSLSSSHLESLSKYIV